MPCAWPVTEDIKMPPHFPLASEEARYQGDGVAVVVAETRALAKDAAELIEVDYEPLPSIANVEKALEDGAPLVHEDLGTNECYVWKLETDELPGGDRGGRRRRLPPVRPAAAHPERDRAAGRARTGRSRPET